MPSTVAKASMPKAMAESARIVSDPMMRIAKAKAHSRIPVGAGDSGGCGQQIINNPGRHAGGAHLVDLCERELIGRACLTKVSHRRIVGDLQVRQPFNVRQCEAATALQGS